MAILASIVLNAERKGGDKNPCVTQAHHHFCQQTNFVFDPVITALELRGRQHCDPPIVANILSDLEY